MLIFRPISHGKIDWYWSLFFVSWHTFLFSHTVVILIFQFYCWQKTLELPINSKMLNLLLLQAVTKAVIASNRLKALGEWITPINPRKSPIATRKAEEGQTEGGNNENLATPEQQATPVAEWSSSIHIKSCSHSASFVRKNHLRGF